MDVLKAIAWTVIGVYGAVILLLYILQTRLIFYPGILEPGFRFKSDIGAKEITLSTDDGEAISGLFFQGERREVILYFHGNAGDLGGWQFVAEDFTALGFNFLIIDYRGYGKSSGRITEEGLYLDGKAAYDYLRNAGFAAEEIIVYGRSIGSGVAVDVVSKQKCKGLILESPFSSLGELANEKLPLFFPSLYLKYKFNNLAKINAIQCPVVFLHGSADSLIPVSHSERLYDRYKGEKKLIVVKGGSHNDLHAFTQYAEFVKEVLPVFF